MSFLISSTAPVYIVNVRDITPSPNKVYLSIFNTDLSGLEVKIIRAIAWNNQISPSQGGEVTVQYQRIADQIDGTEAFLLGANANNPQFQLKILARENASITLDNGFTGSTYFTHQLSTDNTHGIGSADGLTAIMLNMFANPLNYLASIGQPITLGETTGLAITQDASPVSAGKINAQIIFAVETVV